MAYNFLSKWYSEYGCSEVIVSTSFWMFSDDNMFDLSFRSSPICFIISSCILKILSAVYRDTLSVLDNESIMILCCLLWYVYLNCWISSYSSLLIWYHYSWNIFSFLDKESIKNFSVFQSISCLVCCDIFLSTDSAILLIVYFFDPIVLETPSVW